MYFDVGFGFGVGVGVVPVLVFATLCGELVPERKTGVSFGVGFRVNFGVGGVGVLIFVTCCGELVPKCKISWSIWIPLLRSVPGWRKGTPGWGSLIASSRSCRHMVSRLVADVTGVSVLGKKARVFDVQVPLVEGM